MGKTILLADGDSKTCHLLDAKLSFYGYVVITVSNGEEALRFFDQEKPHLVLLDVMLPKIDGYKVCNELRKISSTPIILFSALDTLTDRIIGFNLGADEDGVKESIDLSGFSGITIDYTASKKIKMQVVADEVALGYDVHTVGLISSATSKTFVWS